MNEGRKRRAHLDRLRLQVQEAERELHAKDNNPYDPAVHGFQGAIDTGAKGRVPDNPRTLFDNSLKWQQENPILFQLGGPNHDKILAAVREGWEKRMVMENENEGPEIEIEIR